MNKDPEVFLNELCAKSIHKTNNLPFDDPIFPEFQVSDFESLKGSDIDDPKTIYEFVLKISKDTGFIDVLDNKKFRLSKDGHKRCIDKLIT
jgi:hypothetical protein